MEVNKIYEGDALTLLKTFPDEFVDCCVTSPPYYGLRDYGTAKWIGGDEECDHDLPQGGRNPETSGKQLTNKGTIFHQQHGICKKCGAERIDEQIGLEETPELYILKLVQIFREVKRALKKNGTLWLNLGDSYYGSGQGYGDTKTTNKNHNGSRERKKPVWEKDSNLKPKDLIGMPWMLAFALRSDGWYLRQDIIWSKTNPMPESVTDRCTKAHEYIFLLSKSSKYYYDAAAIKTKLIDHSINEYPFSDGTKKEVLIRQRGMSRNPRKGIDVKGGNQGSTKGIPAMAINGNGVKGHSGNFDASGNLIGNGYANKRSVWTVNNKPYLEAHFATFPEKLIVDMIKAGCPEGGLVLDPFGGANTTGVVSRKLNRNYVAIELNPDYIKIGNNRIHKEIGLFKDTTSVEKELIETK